MNVINEMYSKLPNLVLGFHGCHINHSVELVTFSGGQSAYSVIGIYFNQLPFIIPADVRAVGAS